MARTGCAGQVCRPSMRGRALRRPAFTHASRGGVSPRAPVSALVSVGLEIRCAPMRRPTESGVREAAQLLAFFAVLRFGTEACAMIKMP